MTAPPCPDRRLLRSWKAIADHLGVDARTVQRWRAKTDIPIAREGIGVRAHPSAYTDDLDRWLEQRRHHGGRPAASGPAESRPRWPKIATLVVVSLLVLVALAAALAWTRGAGEPVRLEAAGDLLRVFDANNRLCWERTIPGVGVMRTWQSARGDHDNSLIADVDDDGFVEVLLNIRESASGDATGRLLCLDHRGDERWSYPYGRAKTWQGVTYSRKYSGRWIVKARGSSQAYVVAGAVHSTWFPSQVVLLDPRTGALVEEYWHPGSLLIPVVHDLNRDGLSELLVAGINNPGLGLGHGALVALNIPFSRVQTVREAGPLAAFTGGHEAGYVLFPRPDICSATGVLPFVAAVQMEGDRVLAQVGCGAATAFFYLDRFLRLQDVRLSDGFAAIHDGLFRQKLLDHAFSAAEQDCLAHVAPFPGAVDGNSRDAARAWAACESP